MDEQDLTKALVEVAKDRSADIYNDGLKPATQEAGSALQAIVGLFNNVVLYPIKKANITYIYKLEKFESDLRNKIQDIPPENIVEPPLRITGPTIEALKYTFDTEELREMYLELLSSSMNSQKTKNTHASFVEIIKVFSPMDAVIFKRMAMLGQTATARVTIGFENKVLADALPIFYAPELIEQRNPFEVSKSVQNLARLGLITHVDKTINGFNYNEFKTHPFIQSQLVLCKQNMPDKELVVTIQGEAILLNDFGKAFRNVCVA